MDGFKQGVEYWNEQKGDTVEVLGWDGTDGVFTGGFVANQDAINAAQGLVDQGVDVLLPVGGADLPERRIGHPRLRHGDRAPRRRRRRVRDRPDASPTCCSPRSSRRSTWVSRTPSSPPAQGDFDATPFIGTLENEGVGLAPFHDFEDKVSPDLQGELDEITAGIIDGSIPVTSYLAG